MLALIGAFKPCDIYYTYIEEGDLTPKSTIASILRSKTISFMDKTWLVGYILSGVSTGFIVDAGYYKSRKGWYLTVYDIRAESPVFLEQYWYTTDQLISLCNMALEECEDDLLERA